jgi:hypothetical protein
MELDPLDEHPIHQVPLSMAYVATSDRHAYDRCIHQGVDTEDGTVFLTGLGVYPNLGTIDAFMSVRHGDTQWSLQASGVRPADKLRQEVGPYRIEVVEPFRRLHLTGDGGRPGDELEVGFDLWFESEYDPQREPQHVKYGGPARSILLDGCRYAQVGAWRGELRFGGRTVEVDPARWVGTRDRSWGIRPVGEQPAPGRPATTPPGIWYVWIPLRFDDFGMHFMVEEDPEGNRTLNYAVRFWPTATGRRTEQLGWPEIDITYRSGTRIAEAVTLRGKTADRKTVEVELDLSPGIPLRLGCGYGTGAASGDDEWSHGRWMGESWSRVVTYDHTSAEVEALLPWGPIDHVARATCDGQVGHGIFEHGTVGRHVPTGMDDLTSVAP